MIIWIVALLILALVAIVGYYQGAIRVVFSLVGLIIAAVLAVPLGAIGRLILSLFGMNSPLLLQIFAPALMFLIILVVAKIIAFNVDRKFDYIFKYQKGDYERMKFDRMNARVGFCLGLFNGAIYFFILLIPFYVFGYLTVQVASGEETPTGVKFINQIRQAIQGTKLDRVMGGMDPAPEEFYVASDIIGLMNQNPALQGRLAQYPSLVTFTERAELQDIANDQEIAAMVQRQAQLKEIIEHPKIKALFKNESIWDDAKKLGSDLKDLRTYLETGASTKYGDSPFLGRWNLDIDQTLVYSKRKRPAMSTPEYNLIRNNLLTVLQGGVLTLTTDGRISLRSRGTGAADEQIRTVADGNWRKEGNTISASISQAGKSDNGEITMDSPYRLLFSRGGMVMVFNRPN